jgi:hypothetical protein
VTQLEKFMDPKMHFRSFVGLDAGRGRHRRRQRRRQRSSPTPAGPTDVVGQGGSSSTSHRVMMHARLGPQPTDGNMAPEDASAPVSSIDVPVVAQVPDAPSSPTSPTCMHAGSVPAGNFDLSVSHAAADGGIDGQAHGVIVTTIVHDVGPFLNDVLLMLSLLVLHVMGRLQPSPVFQFGLLQVLLCSPWMNLSWNVFWRVASPSH